VVVATPTVDVDAARAALRRAVDDFSELVASAPSAETPIPDSEWSVGDAAVHIALGTEAYVGYAEGGTEPWVDVSDIAGGSLARSNAARLELESVRSSDVLAARVRDAAGALLDATAGRDGDEPVTWNGQTITLGAMLGMGLGEYRLHGLDVAKALDRPWPISPDDARLVLASALPMLPLLVDPATTAGVRATYDLRVRGGARVQVGIHDGRLTVGGNDERVDCHISAEPVALLLVSYGRRTQWVPVLTGKLVAWGRKPWLGLRLTRYLVTP
jgi:uncharacterized protein (TIGR03083 family)